MSEPKRRDVCGDTIQGRCLDAFKQISAKLGEVNETTTRIDERQKAIHVQLGDVQVALFGNGHRSESLQARVERIETERLQSWKIVAFAIASAGAVAAVVGVIFK